MKEKENKKRSREEEGTQDELLVEKPLDKKKKLENSQYQAIQKENLPPQTIIRRIVGSPVKEKHNKKALTQTSIKDSNNQTPLSLKERRKVNLENIIIKNSENKVKAIKLETKNNSLSISKKEVKNPSIMEQNEHDLETYYQKKREYYRKIGNAIFDPQSPYFGAGVVTIDEREKFLRKFFSSFDKRFNLYLQNQDAITYKSFNKSCKVLFKEFIKENLDFLNQCFEKKISINQDSSPFYNIELESLTTEWVEELKTDLNEQYPKLLESFYMLLKEENNLYKVILSPDSFIKTNFEVAFMQISDWINKNIDDYEENTNYIEVLKKTVNHKLELYIINKLLNGLFSSITPKEDFYLINTLNGSQHTILINLLAIFNLLKNKDGIATKLLNNIYHDIYQQSLDKFGDNFEEVILLSKYIRDNTSFDKLSELQNSNDIKVWLKEHIQNLKNEPSKEINKVSGSLFPVCRKMIIKKNALIEEKKRVEKLIKELFSDTLNNALEKSDPLRDTPSEIFEQADEYLTPKFDIVFLKWQNNNEINKCFTKEHFRKKLFFPSCKNVANELKDQFIKKKITVLQSVLSHYDDKVFEQIEKHITEKQQEEQKEVYLICNEKLVM